jgi:hypothetical protein
LLGLLLSRLFFVAKSSMFQKHPKPLVKRFDDHRHHHHHQSSSYSSLDEKKKNTKKKNQRENKKSDSSSDALYRHSFEREKEEETKMTTMGRNETTKTAPSSS